MSDRPPRSLGESAFRGAAVTGFGQALRISLQVLSVVLLARLLSPEDYGLLAMVTAIIGIGEVFRDFGLSSAAIQARTVTHAQRSNLFWINAGTGAALMIACVAAAPLIATMYGEPRLVEIASALGVTFLVNGFATQYRADLNRAMRFGALAITDVVSQALGLAAGLALAAAGFGYWALVGMQIVSLSASLIGAVLYGRWLPRWYSRRAHIGGFLKFGGGLLGSQLVSYAGKNADSVVIGLMIGPDALGMYNRAMQLLLLPLNQIQAPATRVALPVLSKLQDERERFDGFLLQGQSALLNVVGFVLAFVASQAVALVVFFLGPQWESVAPLFQILSVAGLATMANYACYWVFLAKGLTSNFLVFSLITRPLLIGSVIVGGFFGTAGVAIAFSTSSLLIWPLTLIWLGRFSDAPTGRMFLAGLRAFVVYALAGLASSGFGLLAVGWPPLLMLLAAFGVFVTVLAVTALVFPAYRRDVNGLIAMRHLIRRR